MIVTGLSAANVAIVTETVMVVETASATESDEIGAAIDIEEKQTEIKSL